MAMYQWKPFTLLVSAEEVERKMRLEAGKYYKDSNGKKQGPMVWEPKGWFYVDKQLGCWDKSGSADDSRTESDQGNLISEWYESPIREVNRRELVAGVYGRVYVEPPRSSGKVAIELTEDDGKIGVSGRTSHLSASELREAAHTLNQIAEYLSENEK